MKGRRGSIGSARATRSRRSNKSIPKKVDDYDEPELQQLIRNSFADLPSPITADILLRLPTKSILICKCVCKSWKAVISDPHFAQSHFQQVPADSMMIRAKTPDNQVSRILHLLEFEPENFENDEDDGQFWCCKRDLVIKAECNSNLKLENTLKLPFHWARRDKDKKKGSQKPSKSEDEIFINKVINSSNGLLCLSDQGKENFIACNPVTGEFIRLPKATRVDNTDEMPLHQKIYAGFGFQPKTNEYKVVRIFKKRYMIAQIHTLGTSTWRNLVVKSRYLTRLQFPTCVSGALHWIRVSDYEDKLSILCFNFETERFRSFPCPPHLFKMHCTTSVTMGELKGCLYVCASFSLSYHDTRVKMWIMKKYGFGESWTKVFSIDVTDLCNIGAKIRYHTYCLCWPVKHFKNGGGILMYHSFNWFIYYEPEKNGFKIFKGYGTKSRFKVIPHIPSLISLKDAVKRENIDVQNFHSSCAGLKLHEEIKVLFLAKVNAEARSMICTSSGEETVILET
ncbi:F-box/kelch-repeat protein At3g06240-like [Lotus japonicus]|uniref:F-box/kelch-repeat protein At3g06240-like n=1 Tax=Lotus japonicus TaxID=34305 RepID=UPI002588F68D|nr:F-box/kelch-repeat protein At3g06240-like [Lotus japonicus]XP_057441268.1 F-box/kelch-repeat protein At3g06240-like [Lotus japonicus]